MALKHCSPSLLSRYWPTRIPHPHNNPASFESSFTAPNPKVLADMKSYPSHQSRQLRIHLHSFDLRLDLACPRGHFDLHLYSAYFDALIMSPFTASSGLQRFWPYLRTLGSSKSEFWVFESEFVFLVAMDCETLGQLSLDCGYRGDLIWWSVIECLLSSRVLIWWSVIKDSASSSSDLDFYTQLDHCPLSDCQLTSLCFRYSRELRDHTKWYGIHDAKFLFWSYRNLQKLNTSWGVNCLKIAPRRRWDWINIFHFSDDTWCEALRLESDQSVVLPCAISPLWIYLLKV